MWGKKQRDRYLTELDDSFQRLAGAPGIGQDCSYIREGYRKLHVGRHLVFYRLTSETTIEVVRILHERSDVERHFSE